jgi:hypothetical protein
VKCPQLRSLVLVLPLFLSSLGLSPLTSLIPPLKTGVFLLSPWVPTHFLQKSRGKFRFEVSPAYEAMQKGKGASAESGNWAEDPFEEECGGCNRIRLQIGAIGTNRAFELETLSQHRHMIENLQDESYAQRSQLEDHRMKMETMQRRLDQLEGVQQPPSNPGEQQENSKNEQSNSVNQIPDLNEPHPETMLDIQQVKLEKGN